MTPLLAVEIAFEIQRQRIATQMASCGPVLPQRCVKRPVTSWTCNRPSASTYNNLGCRCEGCQAARRIYRQRQRQGRRQRAA